MYIARGKFEHYKMVEQRLADEVGNIGHQDSAGYPYVQTYEEINQTLPLQARDVQRRWKEAHFGTKN